MLNPIHLTSEVIEVEKYGYVPQTYFYGVTDENHYSAITPLTDRDKAKKWVIDRFKSTYNLDVLTIQPIDKESPEPRQDKHILNAKDSYMNTNKTHIMTYTTKGGVKHTANVRLTTDKKAMDWVIKTFESAMDVTIIGFKPLDNLFKHNRQDSLNLNDNDSHSCH